MVSSPGLAAHLAPMDSLDLLRLPKRRDVKALRATLAPIRSEDYVSALFHDSVYGTFQVIAMAVAATGDRTLLAGGVPLDTGGNRAPATNLYALSHCSAKDAMSADGPLFPNVDLGETFATRTAVHGDVVQVGFHRDPYGGFIVTGQAVTRLGSDGNPGHTTLGPWILSTVGDEGRVKGAVASPFACRVAPEAAGLLVPVPPVPYTLGD